jgi:hypothetical protein
MATRQHNTPRATPPLAIIRRRLLFAATETPNNLLNDAAQMAAPEVEIFPLVSAEGQGTIQRIIFRDVRRPLIDGSTAPYNYATYYYHFIVKNYDTMRHLIADGGIETFQNILEHYSALELEQLEFLHAAGCRLTRAILIMALHSNNVPVVEFLVTHDCDVLHEDWQEAHHLALNNQQFFRVYQLVHNYYFSRTNWVYLPAMVDAINTIAQRVAPKAKLLRVRVKSKEDECSICLDSFGQKHVAELPCHPTHRFHITCLRRWLKEYLKCPLCVTKLAITDTGELVVKT